MIPSIPIRELLEHLDTKLWIYADKPDARRALDGVRWWVSSRGVSVKAAPVPRHPPKTPEQVAATAALFGPLVG